MAGVTKTLTFKLVLLGDSAVGKSSIVARFVKNEFFDGTLPTIGAAFIDHTVTLDDCIVKLQIWDTAGQERYRSLAPMYYRGAAAAFVVYDITSRESFEEAKTWIEELKSRRSTEETEVVISLVGNKVDLESKRQVPNAEANKYATDQGYMFFETSAKNGDNIAEIFMRIAKRLPTSPRDTVVDDWVEKKEASRGPCCSS